MDWKNANKAMHEKVAVANRIKNLPRRVVERRDFDVYWNPKDWAFQIDNSAMPRCRFIEFGPFMLTIVYKEEK